MKSKTQKRREAADRLRKAIESDKLALDTCLHGSHLDPVTRAARAEIFRFLIADNEARLAHLESLNKQNT